MTKRPCVSKTSSKRSRARGRWAGEGRRKIPVQKSNQLIPGVNRILCPELDAQIGRDVIKPSSKIFIPVSERRQAKGAEHAIWARCAADPYYFIFGGFVRTFDEHDRDNPIKAIPDDPYLRRILDWLHSAHEVAALAKSRQMLVSWMLCAYAVWEAHFHGHRKVMIQSKKAEDAYALVFHNDWMTSRCGIIEAAMPEYLWLQDDKRYTHAMRGRLIYPQGSQIWAIPGGAHHFRSHVASLALIDEACFLPDFADTFKAALAMVKGGGRLRVVSSAKYMSYFGQLIEAEQHMAAAA